MSDAIKLYDFATSPNCQRVKVVLEEKGVGYETVPVDLRKQEQKAPEYLALNPHGKVPVLVDGGTVLYESCIINEYLEDKYPDPSLLPADASARARIRHPHRLRHHAYQRQPSGHPRGDDEAGGRA